MAASIHLARAGLRVLCISPESDSEQPVGESLDWSAPALLKDLGLPMDRLIGEHLATCKRHIFVKLPDGSSRRYVPRESLARPPYRLELRTLHVDRRQTDSLMRDTVVRQGVQTIDERVVQVETHGRRVSSVVTTTGQRISSRWFIDASGGNSRLFPRAFRLPSDVYGPRKVAMWTWFDVADSAEGTTLYMDSGPSCMEWIWEIPIHANRISVGYVAAGQAIREKRREGATVEQIFSGRLSRIPRFAPLMPAEPITALNVSSFECRVHHDLAGDNWLVVGESASMVDPMTSNGFTAALRSAAEASALIIRSRNSPRLPRMAGALYSRRIVALGRFFNCGIEKIIYDRPVRNRIGIFRAGHVYTIPAWVMNAIYQRLQPRGLISTLAIGFVLDLFRVGSLALNAFCRQSARLGGETA